MSVLSILHVHPSCETSMYVRPKYPTRMSVLGILHVRPSYVSDMYVRF